MSGAILFYLITYSVKHSSSHVKVKRWSASHSVVSNSLQPHRHTRLLCPWKPPGKSAGGGFHSLFQEIFLIQTWNLGLPHHRQVLAHLSHKGSPSHIVIIQLNMSWLKKEFNKLSVAILVKTKGWQQKMRGFPGWIVELNWVRCQEWFDWWSRWRVPWSEESGRLQSTGSQETDVTLQLHHHRPQFRGVCSLHVRLRERRNNPARVLAGRQVLMCVAKSGPRLITWRVPKGMYNRKPDTGHVVE